MHKGCDLSDCEVHRLNLWRQWEPFRPWLGFVMLNPSTADGNVDDPTIRKCVGFAKRWGFGGLRVCNLFTFRATKPGELYKATAELNHVSADDELRDLVEQCEQIVVGWGAHGAKWPERVTQIQRILLTPLEGRSRPRKVVHLGLTREGHPRHPLFVPYLTSPLPWRP